MVAGSVTASQIYAFKLPTRPFSIMVAERGIHGVLDQDTSLWMLDFVKLVCTMSFRGSRGKEKSWREDKRERERHEKK